MSVNSDIFCSDNGTSPFWCQTIIWTNAGLLLIWILVIHFSRIKIKIQQFSFKGISLKISSKYSGHLVLASMCSSLQLFNHFYCLASCIAFCPRQLPIQLMLLRSNSEFHKKNPYYHFLKTEKLPFIKVKNVLMLSAQTWWFLCRWGCCLAEPFLHHLRKVKCTCLELSCITGIFTENHVSNTNLVLVGYDITAATCANYCWWQKQKRRDISIQRCCLRNPYVEDKTVLALTWESPYLGKTVFILRRWACKLMRSGNASLVI